MGLLLNGIAWIATLAGLAFSLSTSLPVSWSAESAQSWLFHASGWIIALFLNVFYSVRILRIQRVNDATERDLKHGRKEAERENEINQSRCDRLEREVEALVRSNDYIFNRITEPTSATPRKTDRHGAEHD